MLSDTLRQKLLDKTPVSGCTCSGFAPEQVEILGMLGYDFAFIDSEHWPFSDRELLTMIMAGDCAGMPCLVRIKENNPSAIKRALDCGASGIIVPDVSNPELAKKAIDGAKYTPIGERGLSSTRSSWYGLSMGLAEYVKYANEKTVVVCQIETREGVENVDEILKNPHIDCAFIGTTDLSNSLGFTGQRNHPEVNGAVEKVVASAKSAGKAYGTMVRAGENPQIYIEQGYSMTVASGMSFFTGGAKAFIKEFKNK